MSTPKPALNRRIKISKTGRPYIDLADLVNTKIERLERLKQAQEKEQTKNGTTQESPVATTDTLTGSSSSER